MSTTSVLSAHPIDPAMREQIVMRLQRLEVAHDVKVLFACESGNSWLGIRLTGQRLRRALHLREPPVVAPDGGIGPRRDRATDQRRTGRERLGPAQDAAASAPVESDPAGMAAFADYREEADTVARLRALAEDGFSAVRGYHHYVSMAKKNFREHLRGEEVRYKKYLYVLRPLLAARWIRDGKGVPPMRFAALAEATLDDRVLLDEINRLLEVKMRAGEAASSPRWVGIHDFIESELAAAGAQTVADSSRPETLMLDAFLYETVQQNERKKNGTD